MKNPFTTDVGIMHAHYQARRHRDSTIPVEARLLGDYPLGRREWPPLFASFAHVEGAAVLHADGRNYGVAVLQHGVEVTLNGPRQAVDFLVLYVFGAMGRREASSLACIAFVADSQRMKPYTSAMTINTVNPNINNKVVFILISFVLSGRVAGDCDQPKAL